MSTIHLDNDHTGTVTSIYQEALTLDALGPASIRRASHVEPDDQGRWYADLSPVDGPMLGPFDRHSDAHIAEVRWLVGSSLDKADSVADPAADTCGRMFS